MVSRDHLYSELLEQKILVVLANEIPLRAGFARGLLT